MKKTFLAISALMISSAAFAGQAHQCESDAIANADRLLRLHYSNSSSDSDVANLSIDSNVVVKSPVKVPVGKGRLDVLEVTGYVYRATYVMKFKYAQIKGECALMAQEIFELSNPY